MALSKISQVVAAALLTIACGGNDPALSDDVGSPIDVAGSAGQAALPMAGSGSVVTAGAASGGSASGGSASQGGTASAGATQAGSAGAMAQSMAGAGGASGGQPGGGAGGMAQAGDAGSSAGGAGSSAGSAGAAQGGQASDPLEPKPAANCPGYVDVLVPLGTCLLIRGDFTLQNETCNIVNTDEHRSACATVTTSTKDIVTRRSDTATFERFDWKPGVGCPRTCSNG